MRWEDSARDASLMTPEAPPRSRIFSLAAIISRKRHRRGQPMIKRYSDHAANERTFLAWVRTAIAVMAFGFLIERFDLFLRFAAPNLANSPPIAHREGFANLAGMTFLVLGIGMIAIAAWRYFRIGREIDAEEEVHGPGARFDLAMAGMLVLLGCSLLLYLSHAVVAAR
jgi:putative membrane protein